MIEGFDYKNPDYTEVYADRLARAKLLEDPRLVKALKVHYAANPWDFVNDWGMTFEPRNVERGLMTNIPFILWKRQEEYLRWMMDRWKASATRPGLTLYIAARVCWSTPLTRCAHDTVIFSSAVSCVLLIFIFPTPSILRCFTRLLFERLGDRKCFADLI